MEDKIMIKARQKSRS